MSLETNPRLEESEPVRRCGWPACKAACCVYGTWVAEEKIAEILEHAALIRPYLAPGRKSADAWFGKDTEPDPYVPGGRVRPTKVVDDPAHYGGTACVFLMDDYRCALQAAGEAGGLHPWQLKPFYCILHPLDLDEKGRITLDAIRLMVVEEASCLRTAGTKTRLKELFREELGYLGA